MRSQNLSFVLVLSAPRSGSSCLTGCLNLCGLSIGNPDHCNLADKHNPKGYFENKRILAFNHRIMEKFGIDVTEPVRMPETENIEAIVRKFTRILEKEFSSATRGMVKDPRIGVLWPVYRKVMKKIHVIILSRNIDSCSESLQKFFKMPRDACVKLRDSYYELFKDIEEELGCIHVLLESLIENPIKEVKKICDFVGIELSNESKEKIMGFVDPDLIHFRP